MTFVRYYQSPINRGCEAASKRRSVAQLFGDATSGQSFAIFQESVCCESDSAVIKRTRINQDTVHHELTIWTSSDD
jgi:hypothetical protein